MQKVELPLDDFDLAGFVAVAANFGLDRYVYVVTPNIDHMIRYHDDPVFRDLYAHASYILLDSRFLAYLFRVTNGTRTRVCPGSDLTAELITKLSRSSDVIVLIGGSAEQAAELKVRFNLEGLRHFNPPMGFIRDPQLVEECLNFVEEHAPFRFCLLAIGSPQQEMIANKLRERGKARGLTLCIGASINFLT